MRIHAPASLRWRLGIGVIAILVLGVVAADVATYVVARGLYESRLTATLDILTSRILAAEGIEGESAYSANAETISLTDPYIALYSVDGALVAERVPELADGQQAPEVPPPSELGTGPRDISTPGQSNSLVVRARTLAPQEQFTVIEGGEPVVIGSFVVGLTSTRASETFQQFVRAQVVVGVAILLLAIAAVVVLLRVGLRPLVRVARTAEEISAGDLSRRIPVDDPSSEIGAVSVALNDAFDKVEQSEDRMRGFVADASHELRTPLAAIRGWADLYLSDGIREWVDVDVAMTRIRSESDRLGDLVEQLLALARLDAQVEQPVSDVDLPCLAGEIVEQVSLTSPDHRLSVRMVGEVAVLDRVTTSEVLIRQILGNLVSNAVRHTPPGTAVEIRLECEPDGAHVLIGVVDQGPGMSEEQLVQAYDRFWRAEPGRGPTGGTGLGLAIVRSSVLALGGTITVESPSAGGLAVTVRLPSGHPDTPVG